MIKFDTAPISDTSIELPPLMETFRQLSFSCLAYLSFEDFASADFVRRIFSSNPSRGELWQAFKQLFQSQTRLGFVFSLHCHLHSGVEFYNDANALQVVAYLGLQEFVINLVEDKSNIDKSNNPPSNAHPRGIV